MRADRRGDAEPFRPRGEGIDQADVEQILALPPQQRLVFLPEIDAKAAEAGAVVALADAAFREHRNADGAHQRKQVFRRRGDGVDPVLVAVADAEPEVVGRVPRQVDLIEEVLSEIPHLPAGDAVDGEAIEVQGAFTRDAPDRRADIREAIASQGGCVIDGAVEADQALRRVAEEGMPGRAEAEIAAVRDRREVRLEAERPADGKGQRSRGVGAVPGPEAAGPALDRADDARYGAPG
ncbi:hypothetical protein [Methylorubrum thiocyanatum]|uniref:hypothetical protein n=1 Tax=Methylorubrum thiocyanatum TaxID=47958 RepID=UPI0036625C52